MRLLIIVLIILAIPAERPKSEGIFIKIEQTSIPMLAAYKMIERWPAYGGLRRK